MDNKDKVAPHFVTSHDFRGDAEYVAWLQEIKTDIKGFSSRNLWYMKQWYLFYHGDALRQEKLHQLGAEIASPTRVANFIDNGKMLLLFGNPMGVATYQGIKIADKLPSVEALHERIKLLEAQLEQNAG